MTSHLQFSHRYSSERAKLQIRIFLFLISRKSSIPVFKLFVIKMSEILIVFVPLSLCSKTKFSWNDFILLQSFEIYFTALNLFVKVATKLRLHILF